MFRPFLILPFLVSTLLAEPVLDARKLLEVQTFWDNRDFDWFERNIPFLDTPDDELDTTYYYRWEVVTKHLTYGSPDTGYLFTEFIDRPFWSGAYGAISCPSGHQFYEARWLRNPRYARDYLRYWYRTPGAQPRRYSNWLADSAWAVHLVHPNDAFTVDLLPDLEENLRGWVERSWVPEMEMFWQVGHDDGMEYNIASRQTMNIVSGGPCYRPSFNAYMWADLQALAEISELAGKIEDAQAYRRQADALKRQVEEKLWDPERAFFFPMFRDDETDKEGNVVKKNTLMYETGKYAGSPHGRELASYVPWAFNMPSAGLEEAWKFLMDSDYFFAPFGPTTTERNDPQFHLSPTCCWWSGQSWPFATTQTLKAMANVLHHYEQDHVSRTDYSALLHKYAISHRKDGRPYIAEALHPFTGSWEGHDAYFHSEHYFHSGFTDLIITGLIGLQPSESDKLTVDPLAPADWEWFAMDRIPYRGHLISVIWDKTGERYNRGAGFQVLVDGEKRASSPELQKLSAEMPPRVEQPLAPRSEVNHAVNNDGNVYPRLSASHVGPDSSLAFLQDGNTAWYHRRPPLRWTSEGSGRETDQVTLELGVPRRIDRVKLYLLDDGSDRPVVAPERFALEYRDATGQWQSVSQQERNPLEPAGHRPNVIRFPEIETTALRVTFTHQPGKASGMTEFEAWGPAESPYEVAPPPAGNLAFNPDPDAGYPKARASFSDSYGGVPEKAIDGKLSFRPNPMNRWTSYGSPNQTSDWLEIDLGEKKRVGRVVLYIYDDRGGVQPPKNHTVQAWLDGNWRDVPDQKKDPEQPTGGTANTVTFSPVETEKLRVVFEHIGKGDTRSGVTELEVWEE